ncbi:MAG: Rpn family recombination-promoting nuclease/putative transposase, partial [Treponema sp.]|nr:Rpn family recombination-promoting nuclease/putative transposase [Treponema sp.]
MGKKDIAEKNLEAWNDVFADIVNVLLFKGKRLMKEKDLEADTKDNIIKANGEIHEQERDVSKFWKNGEIRISILGFENQTVQDKNMPLRVISYDGASYKQELLDKNLKQKYPVATLVLYFGTDSKWKAPKRLHNCFKIPEELKPFVSDYKINVFDIAWLSDETIDMFKSDFKFVAKYFQTKRKNKEYVPTNDEITHIDSLLKMFSALTGDNYFESVYNDSNLKNKKGGVTMCDIVQGFVNEGIVKGRAEEKADMIRK